MSNSIGNRIAGVFKGIGVKSSQGAAEGGGERPSLQLKQAAKSSVKSPGLKSARSGFVRTIVDTVVKGQKNVRQRIDTLKQSGDISPTTHFVLNEMLDKFSPQEVLKFIEFELDKKLEGTVSGEQIPDQVLSDANQKQIPHLEEMCTFFIEKGNVRRRIDTLKQSGDISPTTHFVLNEMLDKFSPQEVLKFIELELDKKLQGTVSGNPIPDQVLSDANRKQIPHLGEMCTFFVEKKSAIDAAAMEESELKKELERRINGITQKQDPDGCISGALRHVLKNFQASEVEEFMDTKDEDEDEEEDDLSKPLYLIDITTTGSDSTNTNSVIYAFIAKRDELRNALSGKQ